MIDCGWFGCPRVCFLVACGCCGLVDLLRIGWGRFGCCFVFGDCLLVLSAWMLWGLCLGGWLAGLVCVSFVVCCLLLGFIVCVNSVVIIGVCVFCDCSLCVWITVCLVAVAGGCLWF